MMFDFGVSGHPPIIGRPETAHRSMMDAHPALQQNWSPLQGESPMNLNRLPIVAFGLAALFAAASVSAADTEAVDAGADAGIAKQLGELDYQYEIDEDGDYKLVMEVEGDRTQLVYVRSPVHQYGSQSIREVWSPAYRIDGGRFPAPVSDRLLEDSHASVLGAWVKQGEHAIFVVKLAADADTASLDDAIEAAITTADAMENVLAPGTDEF